MAIGKNLTRGGASSIIMHLVLYGTLGLFGADKSSMETQLMDGRANSCLRLKKVWRSLPFVARSDRAGAT
jgi:hypothetical protein